MFRDLNFTVVLSLVGVVVGWLLNETSSLMRGRRERKKIYGRALHRLLQLRELFEEELDRALFAKVLNERGKLDEEHRLLLAKERGRAQLEFLQESNEPLLDVATIDPVFSYELDRHMRGFTHVINVSGAYTSPPASDELNQLWQGALSGGEPLALKILAGDIDKILLKVARRHSLLSLVRTRRYFHKRRELRRNHPKEKLAEDFIAMKELSEKVAQEIKRRRAAGEIIDVFNPPLP